VLYRQELEQRASADYWPGGGGSPNTGVGTGYQVAINTTNNIKSLKQKYGITLDSATSNEVGIKFDSATAFPHLRSTLATVATTGNFNDLTNQPSIVPGIYTLPVMHRLTPTALPFTMTALPKSIE